MRFWRNVFSKAFGWDDHRLGLLTGVENYRFTTDSLITFAAHVRKKNRFIPLLGSSCEGSQKLSSLKRCCVPLESHTQRPLLKLGKTS